MKRKKMMLGIALMMGLTGCGADKNVSIDNYGQKDSPKETSSEVKGDSTNQEEDELNQAFQENAEMTDMDANGVPKHIKCTIGKDKQSMEIDADVCSTGYEQAKIYKIDEVNVDDVYLDDIASKLFDNGEYKVVLPYGYWKVEDLEQEKERLLAKEADTPDRHIEYNRMIHLDMAIDEHEDRTAPNFVSDKSILRESTSDGVCNNSDCTHQYTKLLGTIDGVEHELGYISCVNATGEKSSLTLTCLEPVATMYDMGQIDSNEYVIDKAEAEKKAKDMLDRIGFKDYAFSFGSDVVCVRDEGEDKYYGGYRMMFARQFPELENSMTEDSCVVLFDENDSEKTTTISQNNIDIIAYEGGAMQIDFETFHVLGEPKPDEVKMLDFNQVIQNADAYVANGRKNEEANGYYEQLKALGIKTEIKDIHLSYIPVKHNGELEYVPAWVFSYSGEGSDHYEGRPRMGVFAVDATNGDIYTFTMEYQYKVY